MDRNSISQELAKEIESIKSNKEIWNLFTSKEEYSPILTDRYERFPFYMSANRNIFEPEVSKYIVKNGFDVEYPGNREFAICLTHDIDLLQYSKIATYFEASHFFKGLLHNINKRWNSLWNFQDIIALEEKYEAKSTFFFMNLEKGDEDFDYCVENARDEICNILDKGWEVGLHGGHNAYNNINTLIKEKSGLEKVLGRKVIGYRNHFLRFKVPYTWELLKDAGFCYDATFGHPYCIGFRNGMCHPFKPFDLNTNTEINILEIPLAIMDSSLDKTYMRLNDVISWRLIRRLIETVEKYHGVLTILWHNDSMSKERLNLYTNILRFGRERNAWMTSGKEIYKFWTSNKMAEV